MNKVCLEYIWLDGTKPTAQLRSKTKVVSADEASNPPIWGFDGSSTNQAQGENSDCVLKPVKVYPNIFNGGKLVLCEVFNVDGTPHDSNTRCQLGVIVDNTKDQEPWFGIEQEYTIGRETKTWNSMPLGFNEDEDGELEEPAEQGPYYCSTGGNRAFGRSLVDRHMHACLQTGLAYCGQNAEVMPGQWEFQIGTADPLTVADDLIIARWLLDRLSEEHGWNVSFSGKPLSGDWNGAGCHTNFSTKNMRLPFSGMDAIAKACGDLGEKAASHIKVYGAGVKQRLTGDHETCRWDEFRSGVSDRGASVRIPWQVAKDGHGYLEDRRPNANCDPYLVLHKILETCCT